MSLNQKEILFCQHYSSSLNLKEAAVKAGYPSRSAEKIAHKILAKKETATFLSTLNSTFKRDQILELAIKALKKLIFSRPNDSILLALKLSKTDPKLTEKLLDQLDFFQLTDFKKLKDGGLELKFVDKIKAIAFLFSLADKIDSKTEVNDLITALASTSAETCDECF